MPSRTEDKIPVLIRLVWFYPTNKSGYVIMTNGDNGAKLIFENLIPKGIMVASWQASFDLPDAVLPTPSLEAGASSALH